MQHVPGSGRQPYCLLKFWMQACSHHPAWHALPRVLPPLWPSYWPPLIRNRMRLPFCSTLGFRFVSLANNHALDYKGALPETVRALDAAGIAHAGVGERSGAAPAGLLPRGVGALPIQCAVGRPRARTHAGG